MLFFQSYYLTKEIDENITYKLTFFPNFRDRIIIFPYNSSFHSMVHLIFSQDHNSWNEIIIPQHLLTSKLYNTPWRWWKLYDWLCVHFEWWISGSTNLPSYGSKWILVWAGRERSLIELFGFIGLILLSFGYNFVHQKITIAQEVLKTSQITKVWSDASNWIQLGFNWE